MATASATAFLKLPTPTHQFSSPLFPISSYRRGAGAGTGTGKTSLPNNRIQFILLPVLCASSQTSVVEEEAQDQDQGGAAAAAAPSLDSLPPGACKACGKLETERNCNGEGRIQGGIATVPGFGWWPIKAYRPCPGFVASGGRYRRQGQSMDEVAGLGRERRAPKATTDEAQSSKKKGSPRKFKR